MELGDPIATIAIVALGVTALVLAAVVGHPPLHGQRRRR